MFRVLAHHRRLTVAALVLVGSSSLLAACATTRPATAGDTALPAARMLSRERPDLSSASAARRPEPVRILVDVQVDSAGKPDMSTLRVTGSGATQHRQVITDWISRARFAPAQRGGQPVRGRFRTEMRSTVTVEVRRTGT